MRRIFTLLLLGMLWSGSLWACSGTCKNDLDCASNACRYCETGFGLCSDCCEFTEQALCPSACRWDGATSECRNVATESCGAAAPEIPPGSHRVYYLIVAALVLATAAGAWKIRPGAPK